MKEAIETLLIANPYPVTFSEIELTNRVEWATERYKENTAYTVEDNTAALYRLNYDCTFDLLNKLKAAYKAGQTHAERGHYQSPQSHGYVVMAKSKKQQQEDLKNLVQDITAKYQTEVEQSQHAHLTSLLKSVEEEAAEREKAKREEQQHAARESLISSLLLK
ncbi:TPA: hypothetical protein ACX6Q5_000322 [Photobacterium damselae]